MMRLHLFEVLDQAWCPAPVRHGATDWLAHLMNGHKAFNRVAPKLVDALERSGSSQVVDLCSGGGGPWLTLEREVAKSRKISITLTDLFPNPELGERYVDSQGDFRVHREPVDATCVPSELAGVRTIMSGFHHFRPAEARRILGDAVSKGQPIVVCEGSDNRLKGLAMMTLMPLFMWLGMPAVRPFRWSRLLLTYVVPLLPLVGYWDASVSMLRVYTPKELRDLIESTPGHESFIWDVGTVPVDGSPLGLTYLVGVPRKLQEVS